MKRTEKFRKEQKRLEKFSEVQEAAADSYTLLLAKLDRLINTYENINKLGDL